METTLELGLNIFLCDDEALIRGGIRRIFDCVPDIDVIGEAETGEEAIEKARTMRPDVLLTETRLTGKSGIEIARHLESDRGGLPHVAFLSRFIDQDDVLRGMRAGVRGFMAKSDPPDQLIAGVRSVSAGNGVFSASVFNLVVPVVLNAVADQHRVKLVDLEQLTNREIDVLRFMAEGMSNNEIADSLTLSQATVKSHVSRLLSKMNLRDRSQAIVAAHRVGLVSVPAVRGKDG